MFTSKEKEVLNAIIAGLYAEPGFSDVSADDLVTDELNIHAIGGVIASLEKKGVVDIEELSPRTGHIGLGAHGEGVTIIYLNEEFYHLHPEWAEVYDASSIETGKENEMKDLKDMTIAELTVELNALTGKSVKKAKGSAASIIEQIETLRAEAAPAPAVVEKKKARKRGPSTKEVIRGLYANGDEAYTLDELCAACKTVKPNTVLTAITDLKNPKWSVGSVLNIGKDSDGKFRKLAS